MTADTFFQRWSQRKNAARQENAAVPPDLAPRETAPANGVPAMDAAAPPSAQAMPTLEDVAALSADSDYSAFLVQGVDPAVRRLALKKLFSAPHFNQPDGLDVHMEDYNKIGAMPAMMRGALEHAKSVFARPASDENSSTGSASTQNPLGSPADNQRMFPEETGPVPADPAAGPGPE